MSNDSWSEDRVALLMKLHDEGLSSSQIANRMGGLSRSAVIGKIHRLGIARHQAPKPKKMASHINRHIIRANKTPHTHAAVGNGASYQYGKQFGALPPSAAIKRDPDGLPWCEIYIEPKDRKSIIELDERDCRWPIGDPRDETFHFCGRERFEGTSYCAHHAQVAFVPPEPKRQRNDRKPSESDSMDAPTAVNDNVQDPVGEKEMA